LVNTFVPYLGLWVLMIYLIETGTPYWITLVLAVVAAGFMVRIFIFFHDAGHGSFFSSPRANTALGYISGVLTFTPYDSWRRSHARHHATSGNLDRRGMGDVWTMTVEEYRAAPRKKQLAYRMYRNPLVMFGLGPVGSFLIAQRFPQIGVKRREQLSVLGTDLALLAIIVLASVTIGFWTYVLIQLPIILIGGALGIWLFYVQHQYEGVYWARDEAWDPTKAALEGSSFYKLPKVLQWFTGNIGLHHIHHLRPRIPNYNLQQCYDKVPAMQAVQPLTIGKSLKSLRMNLWDEKQQKLVSFRSL
ncbi:MAG TPA: fatty acid desaturase, partial [Anaerolineae bacterium]|nr:fatty acid desaturase [Anaerolineae bacterium]